MIVSVQLNARYSGSNRGRSACGSACLSLLLPPGDCAPCAGLQDGPQHCGAVEWCTSCNGGVDEDDADVQGPG